MVNLQNVYLFPNFFCFFNFTNFSKFAHQSYQSFLLLHFQFCSIHEYINLIQNYFCILPVDEILETKLNCKLNWLLVFITLHNNMDFLTGSHLVRIWLAYPAIKLFSLFKFCLGEQQKSILRFSNNRFSMKQGHNRHKLVLCLSLLTETKRGYSECRKNVTYKTLI